MTGYKPDSTVTVSVKLPLKQAVQLNKYSAGKTKVVRDAVSLFLKIFEPDGAPIKEIQEPQDQLVYSCPDCSNHSLRKESIHPYNDVSVYCCTVCHSLWRKHGTLLSLVQEGKLEARV